MRNLLGPGFIPLGSFFVIFQSLRREFGSKAEFVAGANLEELNSLALGFFGVYEFLALF
jgi:hypothetical protein